MPKMTKKFEEWSIELLADAEAFYDPQTNELAMFIPEVERVIHKAYQKGIREGKEKNSPRFVGGIRKVTKKTLHTTRA